MLIAKENQGNAFQGNQIHTTPGHLGSPQSNPAQDSGYGLNLAFLHNLMSLLTAWLKKLNSQCFAKDVDTHFNANGPWGPGIYPAIKLRQNQHDTSDALSGAEIVC
jgi:hypothetical protein